MVYLVELLVAMTDWLKIVRICTRNAPYTDTSACRRRRVSRVSLSLPHPPGKHNGVTCSMSRGAVPMKHKNRLKTTCECLAVASKQES